MLYETEQIEFKEIGTDDIYKEVIAFANTYGGTIFVGINDKGSEQIRQMIKSADNDIYEEMRSLSQDLTFHSASETFAKHGVDFDTDKYYALSIQAKESEQFTNLGLLLSDQCTHTVKAAIFADHKKTVFRDRKEFSGGLFKQLEDTFDYLQLCNQNRSVIDGLERIDYWDYPKAAIREAMLNALIHREYSFSGSTIINMTDTEIEFISMGGLVAGLTDADIRNGISQPRNRNLAAVFHRLNFIEAYGTGIRRIFALYEGCAAQPSIETTPNSFKLTLPNKNAAVKGLAKPTKTTITPQMQTALDYLMEHKIMDEDTLQELLGIKRTRAYYLAKEMDEAGLIKIVGRGKERRYIAV